MSESSLVLTLVLVDGVAHDAAEYFSKLRKELQGLRQEHSKMKARLEEFELKAMSCTKELDSIWKQYVDLKNAYASEKKQNWKLSEEFKLAQEIWNKEKEAFAKGGASD